MSLKARQALDSYLEWCSQKGFDTGPGEPLFRILSRNGYGNRLGYWGIYELHVARNYIPKTVGLEMLKYCEKLVAIFELDDLERAHDEAIRMTQMKFRQRLDTEKLGR